MSDFAIAMICITIIFIVPEVIEMILEYFKNKRKDNK